jgi:type I restriction-modification system DNA methylase subunit
MALTAKIINDLLEIDDSYKAPDAMMRILFDREKREQLFRSFLQYEINLDYEWFHNYFQDEHADRKVKKQDFTPYSISTLLSKLVGSGNGMNLDVAAGTGGLTIQKWHLDQMQTNPFDYKPSNYFYQCEELSDRAIPFLLFNLMIRGMNATVVHGDSLEREVKQVYFIQNDNDDFLRFSSLNVMPHNEMVTKEFSVIKWIDDPIDHIESIKWPEHLGTLEQEDLKEGQLELF